jgi:hypothetical protein
MKAQSDGSTAIYYELPKGATELQHLISAKDMNAQIGEIFRACYRYGEVAHSPKIRDINKIIFYAVAELERLEALDRAVMEHLEASTVGDCDLCGQWADPLVTGVCRECAAKTPLKGATDEQQPSIEA